MTSAQQTGSTKQINQILQFEKHPLPFLCTAVHLIFQAFIMKISLNSPVSRNNKQPETGKATGLSVTRGQGVNAERESV